MQTGIDFLKGSFAMVSQKLKDIQGSPNGWNPINSFSQRLALSSQKLRYQTIGSHNKLCPLFVNPYSDPFPDLRTRAPFRLHPKPFSEANRHPRRRGYQEFVFLIDSAAKGKLYFPFKRVLYKSGLMTGVMTGNFGK